MAKRSTNLAGGNKSQLKVSRVIELMRWFGMTDEEIKAALAKK